MSGFLEAPRGPSARFGHAQAIARRGGWCNFNVGEDFSAAVVTDAPAIAGRRRMQDFGMVKECP